MRGYQQDLAYIHDAGFSDYALGAAPGLLRILRNHGVTHGLVVDLGCGSGRWARELNRAGYQVFGVDQSSAMVRLARKVASGSRFKVASLWNAALPSCDAITSIGECLNYCFDRKSNKRALFRLFERLHRALRPGGLFICDFAGPSRRPGRRGRKHRSAGRNWVVVATTTARGRRGIRRHIVAFRWVGRKWRRSEEIHDLQLYRIGEICEGLKGCGFRVRAVKGYGRFRFPRGIRGVVAMKPGSRAD